MVDVICWIACIHVWIYKLFAIELCIVELFHQIYNITFSIFFIVFDLDVINIFEDECK